jgi:CheY-like chemotaxis protein
MPLNVLLADDHADTLEILMRMLQRWGHSCTVAHSAAQARKAAVETRFDVVLCDYHLGDGTCCDMLEAIRQLYPICGVHRTRRRGASRAGDRRRLRRLPHQAGQP